MSSLSTSSAFCGLVAVRVISSMEASFWSGRVTLRAERSPRTVSSTGVRCTMMLRPVHCGFMPAVGCTEMVAKGSSREVA